MPSSWDVYSIVFLSAVLALGIPGILAAISFIVLPHQKRKNLQTQSADSRTHSANSGGTVAGRKINGRFFSSANAAFVLITLILSAIPCVGILHVSAGNPEEILRAMLCIVSVAAFAALGLLYSAKKGDLSWLDSFQKKNE